MSWNYPNTLSNGIDIDGDNLQENFDKVRTEDLLKLTKTENIKTLEGDVYSTLVVGECAPFIVPENLTITGFQIACKTAPTGADVIVDIHNEADTTIYTTQANRPTIPAGSKKSTETVPNIVSLSKGALLRPYIDQIGSSVKGTDLKIQMRYIMQ